MNIKLSNGFTLIELMIVVALIGILAALAMPAYQGYVERARRADAKAAVLAVQLAEEKWRANNSTFTDDMTDLGYPGANSQASPDDYYLVTVTNSSGTTYSINASIDVNEAQNGDDCGTFTFERKLVAGVITEIYSAGGDDDLCWKK